MKPRKVKHLDPTGPLGDQLEKIVLVRLDELCAFMPAAEDPREVEALHDMRIAAKRLRYVLEVAQEVLGPYAAKAIKRVKELQDVLGEIHDADVHLPGVLALAARARAADVAAARARAAGDHVAVEDVADLPHADAHRGLATLATYHQARREQDFASFLALWTELERDGFRARLEYAAGERPSPDGDGVETPTS